MLFRGVVVLLVCCTTLLFVSCSNGPRSQSRAAQYVVEGGAGTGKRWKDNRQFEKSVIIEPLSKDGIHDPENPAIESLQNPKQSMSDFPNDRRGAVDWVKTLDLGLINPRETLDGEKGMNVLDKDILFKDTGQMPWVRFPHLAHTKWLDCSNCHPDIFIPKKGANNPSMDGILAGEYCGRCHDKVAFALWICERCHSVPHKNSPKKWW
jgi:c(7)-type cytochrome triheme protein